MFDAPPTGKAPSKPGGTPWQQSPIPPPGPTWVLCKLSRVAEWSKPPKCGGIQSPDSRNPHGWRVREPASVLSRFPKFEKWLKTGTEFPAHPARRQYYRLCWQRLGRAGASLRSVVLTPTRISRGTYPAGRSGHTSLGYSRPKKNPRFFSYEPLPHFQSLVQNCPKLQPVFLWRRVKSGATNAGLGSWESRPACPATPSVAQ